MPTHQDLLQHLEQKKDYYTEKLEITLGVLIVLIIAYFAIKVVAPELWPLII